MPYGNEPTTHLLKPGIAGFDGHAVNEHLCLATARLLGLRAARSQIVTFDDQTAVAVRRFDRFHREGAVVRVHQEDLCQALAVHPDDKYQSDGGPSRLHDRVIAWSRRCLTSLGAPRQIPRPWHP